MWSLEHAVHIFHDIKPTGNGEFLNRADVSLRAHYGVK